MFLRDQTLVAQAFDVNRLDVVGNPVPIAEGVAIGGSSGATGAFTIADAGVLAYQTGFQSASESSERMRDVLQVAGHLIKKYLRSRALHTFAAIAGALQG